MNILIIDCPAPPNCGTTPAKSMVRVVGGLPEPPANAFKWDPGVDSTQWNSTRVGKRQRQAVSPGGEKVNTQKMGEIRETKEQPDPGH